MPPQSWDPGPALAITRPGRRVAPWRRTARAISGFVLVILLAGAVAMTGMIAVGVRPRVEATGSMEPYLSPGDLVFIRDVAAHEPRVGDVVAFRQPGGDRVIVHRATRIAPEPGERLVFTTRGDANTASETWRIRADGRMGIVSFRVPEAGRVLRALGATPWGILPLAATMLLGVLALRRIWRPA